MSPRRFLARLRGEEGGAMVEFALVVPLLLTFVMGVVEFGRAWNTYQVITDAAREGARRAVVREGDTAAKVGGEALGRVPAVVLERLARGGVPLGDDTWDPEHYTDDCEGWTPPAGSAESATIHGCGWGRQTGDEARVVIRTPYPFFFLRPVIAFTGAEMLETNFVMRNE